MTWTNVDWTSVKFSDIHIRAISQERPQPSIPKIHLEITYLKFHTNYPGANELSAAYRHVCSLSIPDLQMYIIFRLDIFKYIFWHQNYGIFIQISPKFLPWQEALVQLMAWHWHWLQNIESIRFHLLAHFISVRWARSLPLKQSIRNNCLHPFTRDSLIWLKEAQFDWKIDTALSVKGVPTSNIFMTKTEADTGDLLKAENCNTAKSEAFIKCLPSCLHDFEIWFL